MIETTLVVSSEKIAISSLTEKAAPTGG